MSLSADSIDPLTSMRQVDTVVGRSIALLVGAAALAFDVIGKHGGPPGWIPLVGGFLLGAAGGILLRQRLAVTASGAGLNTPALFAISLAGVVVGSGGMILTGIGPGGRQVLVGVVAGTLILAALVPARKDSI